MDFFVNDSRRSNIEDADPTRSQLLAASSQQTEEFNPTTQMKHIQNIKEMRPTTDWSQFGLRSPLPEKPEEQVMTADEANARGKDLGLRFTEKQTESQFNYYADLKRKENDRALILSKTPAFFDAPGTRIAMLVSDLASTALDPINAASAFVPIVGPARFSAMRVALGRPAARFVKGVAEGAAGAALVEPLIYAQAQSLQQNFTVQDSFNDVIYGGLIGGGLHMAAGGIASTIRRHEMSGVLRHLREYDATMSSARISGGFSDVLDWRKVRVPDGETPSLIGALSREDQGALMRAAVTSVETDKSPRMDELLKHFPEARGVAMHDSKAPATMRLRSPFDHSDFVGDTMAARLMEGFLASTIKGANNPIPATRFNAIYDHFVKSYKKLGDWELQTFTPELFDHQSSGLIDTVGQTAVIDEANRKIYASEAASLGAVRHEIERALDVSYGYTGANAGGYRYRRGDVDGPVVHRLAMKTIEEENPSRRPQTPNAPTPEETIDLFSRAEPIMGAGGEKASSQAWDRLQDSKDKDIDTLLKEDEQIAIEDSARYISQRAHNLGIVDKVIPFEDHELFTIEQLSSARRDVVNKVDEAINAAAEKKLEVQQLEDIRALIDLGPEGLRAIIAGDLSIDDAAAVARLPKLERKAVLDGSLALDDVKETVGKTGLSRAETIHQIDDWLKIRKGDPINLTPDERNTAVRLIQDGEDIDKAVAEAQKVPAVDQKVSDEALSADINKAISGFFSDEMSAAEERLILDEHAELAQSKAKVAKDLFSNTERVEFDEANRSRALRESGGTFGSREGSAAAGAGHALEEGLFATRTGGNVPELGRASVVEAERGVAGGERGSPETAQSIGAWTIPSKVITPDGSIEVNVAPRIVELESLKFASGKLHPRDRTTQENKLTSYKRAARIDPEQLMPTRVADSGPPIVRQNIDGTYEILSGNGRAETLGFVYKDETLGWAAGKYRARLGPAADGYRRPVLVNVLTDQLSQEELVAFADRANRPRIASMTSVERARRDVASAGPDLMMMYQGGEFDAKANQTFVRAFVYRVTTKEESNEMSRDGRLLASGVTRLNAAVMAAAYEDTGLLARMLESTDDNIRSITNAYRDVAPLVMKLRHAILNGDIREDFNIAPYMIEAMQFIAKNRDAKVKITNALAQQDAFTKISDTTEILIRLFHNDTLTRTTSSSRIAEILGFYISDTLDNHRTGQMFYDHATVGNVLDVAGRKKTQIDADDPTGLLGPEQRSGTGGEKVGIPAPEPAPLGAGSRAGGAGEAAGSAFVANEQLPKLKVAELRDLAAKEGVTIAPKAKKGEIVGAIMEARKVNPPSDVQLLKSSERGGFLPDEELTPVEAPTIPFEITDRFYDYLEGADPIKGANHISKILKISVDDAYRVIDAAVETGWLRQRDNGTYLRTPASKRPVRPARGGGSSGEDAILSDPSFAGKVDGFIDGGSKNAWINGNGFEIYIRKSMRINPLSKDELIKTFDIANVTVNKTGQGTFRDMLAIVEDSAARKGFDAIYVENIMTDQFSNFFRKNGWIEEKDLSGMSSFTKMLDQPSSFAAQAAPRGWGVAGGDLTARPLTSAEKFVRWRQTNLVIRKVIDEALKTVPSITRFEVLDTIRPFGREGASMAGMHSWELDRSGKLIKSIVSLARDSRKDFREVVNHEIVHVLRAARLFSDAEWKIVMRAAVDEKWMTEQAIKNYTGYFLNQGSISDRVIADRLIEEAIATRYGKWRAERKVPSTPTEMLFRRIDDFLGALAGGVRKLFGRENAYDVFKAIERGDIAQRWQEWGGGRIGDANPNSLHSHATREFADDLNAAMKSLSNDDNEKLGNLRVKAMEALSNCVSANL